MCYNCFVYTANTVFNTKYLSNINKHKMYYYCNNFHERNNIYLSSTITLCAIIILLLPITNYSHVQ